jgi:hypothetical protein
MHHTGMCVHEHDIFRVSQVSTRFLKERIGGEAA